MRRYFLIVFGFNNKFICLFVLVIMYLLSVVDDDGLFCVLEVMMDLLLFNFRFVSYVGVGARNSFSRKVVIK